MLLGGVVIAAAGLAIGATGVLLVVGLGRAIAGLS